jgi:hypothetical protein
MTTKNAKDRIVSKEDSVPQLDPEKVRWIEYLIDELSLLESKRYEMDKECNRLQKCMTRMSGPILQTTYFQLNGLLKALADHHASLEASPIFESGPLQSEIEHFSLQARILIDEMRRIRKQIYRETR